MRRLLAILWTASAALWTPGEAWSFPEMARHGYRACTNCHVNPNGGGILRSFGRTVSRTTLSTWGAEGEEDFAYGAVGLPAWLELGGNVRALASHRRSDRGRDTRLILMEADLEAAVTLDDWALVATLGPKGLIGPDFTNRGLISRRHYLLFRPAPQLSLRAGRFFHAFGINTPDHVIATRRGLGWGKASQTYNMEAAWFGGTYDVFLTTSLGHLGVPEVDREKGVAARGRWYAGERARAGLGYFYGFDERSTRHVYGPFATVGFSPRAFLLVQVSFQNETPAEGRRTFGMVDYLRLDYEVLQGLHGFVTQEWVQLDFSEAGTRHYAVGAGVQFFPRPHWEITGSWQKRKRPQSNDLSDFGWLMMHFYP